MSGILNDFVVKNKKKVLSSDSSLLILCMWKLYAVW